MVNKTFSSIVSWLYKYSFYIILVLGIAFRLYYYILNPSFFLDEARTGAFLYKDIDWYFGITWPMGQLWLQQGIGALFGYSEYVLRLTPLLASIASLFVVYKLMFKWFGKQFATLFIALFAFSPLVVQFSIEYKQYSVDLLVTALYMLIFTNILNSKIDKKKNYNDNVVWFNKNIIVLLVISIVGPWFSYPLIFSIITCTTFYILCAKLKLSKDNLRIGIIAILGVISFGFLYILFIKKSTQAVGLVDYWNEYYMPLNPVEFLHWVKFISKDIVINLLGFKSYTRYLGFILLSLGILNIILQKKYKAALFFISPLLLVLIASIFKKYPFGERVTFFLLPSFYILVVYGILAFKSIVETVLSKLKINIKGISKESLGISVSYLVYAITLSSLIAVSIVYMHTIVIREPLRPVMERMARIYNDQSQDVAYLPIHISATSKDAWKYYNHRFNIGLDRKDSITFSTWDTKGMIKDINNTKIGTWFVFSHITEPVLNSYLKAMNEKGQISTDIYFKDYPTTRAIFFIPNPK